VVRPRGAPRARGAAQGPSLPYITRKIKEYEVLDEEGLQLIEANADTVLEEIGIEFRDDPEALALWKDAGADVRGERVHFPKGSAANSLLKTAPSNFTWHARNPERSACRSAARPPSSPRSTARPSCATWKATAAMPRSRISAIS
jgi:trimethylamine:corrinoid methyltransferase-like protein